MFGIILIVFFKQKTAYEMRISDWSSDVCSSDLKDVFRVAIVEFMDRYNFDLGGVKRSCIHFLTPERQIIPFDTYNLFYRNGEIKRIRSGLARAQREPQHV